MELTEPSNTYHTYHTYHVKHLKSKMYGFMRTWMVLAALALLAVAHGAQGATPSVHQDAKVLPTAVRANWRARCKSRRDNCLSVARAMQSSRQPNRTCVYNACCSCYYACNRSGRRVYRKDCLNIKRAWAQGGCSKKRASWRRGC